MVKMNIKHLNFMIIETLYTMLGSLCFRRFLLQSYVNFGIIVEFGYGKEPQPFIILFKITCTGRGILEEKVKKTFIKNRIMSSLVYFSSIVLEKT